MRIKRVTTDAASRELTITWLTGLKTIKQMAPLLRQKRWSALREPKTFDQAAIIDGGHAIGWGSACPEELDASQLWLEASEAVLAAHSVEMTGDEFKSWMERCGYTLDSGAEALGISRRTVANYRSGDADIPRVVKFACILIEGWLTGRGVPAEE